MRSRLVPWVLRYLSDRGGDADAVADAFAVPASLRDPLSWSMDAPAIDVDVARRLCDRAAAELGEPRLGLVVAESLPRGAYGVLEFAARNAPTVRGAASRLVRYQRLINDAVECSIVESPDAVAIRHALPGSPDCVGAHGNLFTLSVLHRSFREIGVRSPPLRVEVAHRGPALELKSVFGSDNVRFGAGYNALTYPPEVFDAEVLGADATLLPVLDGYAQKLVPPEDPAASWRARVREHLRRSLSGGAPSLEETARHLSTSTRNLQRQLTALNTTYSLVIDELRAEEARRLVHDQTLSVTEIAFLLGYSESRAFLRAFKRWTGESPKRFRGGGAKSP